MNYEPVSVFHTVYLVLRTTHYALRITFYALRITHYASGTLGHLARARQFEREGRPLADLTRNGKLAAIPVVARIPVLRDHALRNAVTTLASKRLPASLVMVSTANAGA